MKKQILIITEDKKLTTKYNKHLKERDYKLSSTKYTTDFKRKLQDRDYGVILIDIRKPARVLNGRIIQNIRTIKGRTPILLISNMMPQSFQDTLYSCYGITDIIDNSFSFDIIIKALDFYILRSNPKGIKFKHYNSCLDI